MTVLCQRPDLFCQETIAPNIFSGDLQYGVAIFHDKSPGRSKRVSTRAILEWFKPNVHAM